MNKLRPIPPSAPPTANSSRALLVRKRLDLKVVETRHKHDSAIVVKDPIAMKYHRLRPDEYFVLERLDGNTTLEQIRSAYETTYAPQKVTTGELNQLVFRLHQSGLTISDVALQGDRLRERNQKEKTQKRIGHLTSLLFIRFPGVDPAPLLDRLYPLMRPLMNKVGATAAVAIMVFAAIVFGLHFDEFMSQFPEMGKWIRIEAVLILAAVIGSTKVLHELGHAIMCKHFGGECHQIGPMLLVFTPALYCDTSDSWMLPSRWQRAAVGLAGIGTEVILASIATIVWASTAPGLVHYVAMNVMLVCSVSTVLFNANPLLRYDGYFVLSDLVDVPNLGERSRRLLSGYAMKATMGVDELPDAMMSKTESFWLMLYAVLAFVYRWSLT
ncbi:MAG: site-2 protease family protein, partial [Rubripirellula sp.]